MLSCRKSDWIRASTLLGLAVLLLVAFANSSWAAAPTVAGSTVSLATLTRFPFLSPDVDQARMLANSFMFQMALFTGATGTSGTAGTAGSVVAIRLLAMLGTMVGALLILFFPKYQKPAVYMSWGLLVIIVIFVPLASKLLFYPIHFETTTMINRAPSGTNAPAQDGTQDCTKTPGWCGFTPQLIAIHLGSMLQMITSDIFRSGAWQGLMERQAAATELYTHPEDFDLSAGWVQLANDMQRCPPNINTRTVVDGTAQDTNQPRPATLMEAWHQLDNFYNSTNGEYMQTPPLIVFPETPADVGASSTGTTTPAAATGTTTGTTTTAATSVTWDPTTIANYEKGIQDLCSVFCDPTVLAQGGSTAATGTGTPAAGAATTPGRLTGSIPVKMDPTAASQAGGITVQAAIASMKANPNAPLFGVILPSTTGFSGTLSSGATNIYNSTVGLFADVQRLPEQGPGVFFATMTDFKNNTSDPMKTRQCFVQTAQASWLSQVILNAGQACRDANVGVLGSTTADYYFVPKMQAATYASVTPMLAPGTRAGNYPTPWNKLLDMMKNDPDVMNMPVVHGDVSGQDVAAAQTNPPTFPARTGSVSNGLTCLGTAKKIINDAVSALQTKEPEGYFAGLANMLKLDGATTIPTDRLLTSTDITGSQSGTASNATEDALAAVPDKAKLVDQMTVRMNEAIRNVNQNNLPDGETAQVALKSAMIDSLLELDKRVSMQAGSMQDNSQTSNAVTDGSTPTIMRALQGKSIIGDVAFFFGQMITKLGAWITGPLALTFIRFLSVLVNFTLMIIITITPLLFLFGLVIPTAAAGVLTISVLAVFVLKFTPVTLIILNGVGGMVYDLLPGSLGTEADFTRDVLVVAMGGLYMNIVGLTFFLLFKIGDPAAVLGRLAALDGAAKQLADRGMAATIAAAGIAAGMVGGGLAGVGGRAMLGRASKQALNAAGVDPRIAGQISEVGGAVADRAQMGTPETPNETPTQKAEREKKEAELAAQNAQQAEQQANQPIMGEDGLPLRDDEGNLLTAEQRSSFRAARDLGMTPEQARQVALGKQVDMGDGRVYGLGANGVPVRVGDDGSNSMTPPAGAPVTPTSGGGIAGGAIAGGPVTAGGGAIQVSVVGGQLGSVGEISRMPQGAATDVQTQVSEIEKAQTAQQVAERKAQLDQMEKDPKTTDAQREKIMQMRQELDTVGSKEDLARVDKSVQATMRDFGTSPAELERRKNLTRNLNDEVALEMTSMETKMAAITQKEAKKEKLTDGEQKFKASYDDNMKQLRDKTDTAGITQAELFARQGTVQNMRRAREAREGADKMPGYLASGLSGVYGSLAGAGGGLKSIPILGKAVAEAANEYYQAPERARGVQAAGGISKWMDARANAQRMGFYQKEMAPIVAGHQYTSMMQTGAFQAQADLARQAASEAVAKSRTQYEALKAHKIAENTPQNRSEYAAQVRAQLDTSGLSAGTIQTRVDAAVQARFDPNSNFMSSVELAGLGRVEAADRVASVRGEAQLMQQASLTVNRGNIVTDSAGNMSFARNKDGSLDTSTRSENVVLTADVLNQARGVMGVKKIASSIDEMMITHYGLAEKMHLRGDAEWDASRGMHGSARAAAAFARKDVSTDYLIGGHLKMVSGKEKFLEGRGQYETLLTFRNQSNKMVSDYVQKAMLSAGGDMAKALQNANIDTSKLRDSFGNMPVGRAQMVNGRAQLDKWASAQLKKNNVLVPLNAVFDGVESKGAATYKRKASEALYNIASENAETWVKMQDAASKSYASALPNVANFTRDIGFEHQGVKFGIGKANKQWFEKMNSIVGDRVTEVDKMFTDYFKERQDSIKIGLNKTDKVGTMQIDKDAWNDFLVNKVRSYDQTLFDKITAAQASGRHIRDAKDGSGNMEFGRVSAGVADKNGNVTSPEEEY